MVLNMKRIFLASCQEDMASLPEALKDRNMDVRVLKKPERALAECLEYAPDLAIVDAVQPVNSGLFLCAQLRAHKRTLPVLFIQPNGRQVRITDAVTIGASDCVTRALGVQGIADKAEQLFMRAEEAPSLRVQDVTLDPQTRELRCADGAVTLTPTEARLMRALMEGKNRIQTREELMEAIWKGETFRSGEMLTVNVNHLRTKLRRLGRADLILTQKRTGYMVHD